MSPCLIEILGLLAVRHPGDDENTRYMRQELLRFACRQVHLRTGLKESLVEGAAHKFARTRDLVADPIQNRDRSDLLPILGALDAQGFTAELVAELAQHGFEITEPEQPEGQGDALHSDDFRSVRWFGADYTFTGNQAACVEALWEAWENLTPEVGDETVKERADIQGDRLDMVFRDNPAWGTMIKPGSTKGTHRLSPPE